MYLHHISHKRKDIVHLTVPAWHTVIFAEACLHSGGANDSTNHLYQLFACMVSPANHLPASEVFKYGWKGADDDLDAIIEYIDEKGGDECGDYASDENMNDDSDGGGRKQKSHGGM